MAEQTSNPLDPLVALQNETQGMAADAMQAVQAAAQTAQAIAADIAKGPAGPATAGIDESSVAGTFEMPAPVPAAPLAMNAKDLQRLLSIEVPLIVQLGRRRMTVAEVTRFAVGAIIEFNKSADEELELLANNKTVGKGHAVKVGENFGIRISAIGTVQETIRKLGGAG